MKKRKPIKVAVSTAPDYRLTDPDFRALDEFLPRCKISLQCPRSSNRTEPNLRQAKPNLRQEKPMKAKQIDKQNLPKPSDILTPDVFACVRAYLLARAYAECERERVDAIHAQILEECPIKVDPPSHRAGEFITRSSDLYLSDDEDACQDFYQEADKRLRAAGIKTAGMERDICPALVAESLLRDAERLLIDTAGAPLGVTATKLLNIGLEKYHKFTELMVTMVVQSPSFKAPTL